MSNGRRTPLEYRKSRLGWRGSSPLVPCVAIDASQSVPHTHCTSPSSHCCCHLVDLPCPYRPHLQQHTHRTASTHHGLVRGMRGLDRGQASSRGKDRFTR